MKKDAVVTILDVFFFPMRNKMNSRRSSENATVVFLGNNSYCFQTRIPQQFFGTILTMRFQIKISPDLGFTKLKYFNLTFSL